MTYLQIDQEKIRHNIQAIRKKAGNAELIAVLKINAYGIGLREIYPLLHENNVKYLAVTEPADAMILREEGATEDILVLRSIYDTNELQILLDANAIATIGSVEAAAALNKLAAEQNKICKVHIKINTGMGRYGFAPNETALITAVYSYPNLQVSGMFTHFPCAFSDPKATKLQQETFLQVVEEIQNLSFEIGMLHTCNTAALFACDVAPLNAVRIGSAISGRTTAKGVTDLQKVGVLCSSIAEIHTLPKGHGVGYGAAYVTKKPTKIGIIPVGTADGYMVEKARDSYRWKDCIRYAVSDLLHIVRKRPNYVYIGSQKAPVIGHVGTTHTTIDLTGIDCTIGTPVTMQVSPMFVPPHIRRVYQ